MIKMRSNAAFEINLRRYIQGFAAVRATMRLDPTLGVAVAVNAAWSAALASHAAWAAAVAVYVGGAWHAMLSSVAAQAALAPALALAAAALVMFTMFTVFKPARRDELAKLREVMVGRCRLTVSKPLWKAPIISALGTKLS